MRGQKAIGFDVVRQVFVDNNDLNNSRNFWEYNRILEANILSGRKWFVFFIDQSIAKETILGWHHHGVGGKILTAETGATVGSVVEGLKGFWGEYGISHPECWKSILRSTENLSGPIFLSTKPLAGFRHKEYENIKLKGSYYYLDGLQANSTWAFESEG